MKAVIQRVMNAKVAVNGEIVSNIGQGACVFIGICGNDNEKDMETFARKILSIKLFDDENDKKWKKSIVDKDFELLCVSQFTLYNTWKGNKPDFHNAMPSEKAKEFYEKLIERLKSIYKPEKIKDGVFGAYMQVSLQNDGPVTLEIEIPSQNNNEKGNKKQKAMEATHNKESKINDSEDVKKILSVKLFDDDNGKKWKKSVVDKELEILIVSQYTICNGWKGNTPDFHKIMNGEKTQEYYNNMMVMLREQYSQEKVKDGVFGIYRQLYLENDGPVTFQIESPASCCEEI